MNNNTRSETRHIRVFVSSTFSDMIEDRDVLMTHCWPQLRKFCTERHVELTEVDLRWGISEEQSTRKETLKLCLDEIHACRPFFVGLLGERYGWVPGEESFTNDLQQEQPWICEMLGKSVTELEILHGVLNNPEMTGRAFFFFRDPEYSKQKGDKYLSENNESSRKQTKLKETILEISRQKGSPSVTAYSDPFDLASMVLERLRSIIDIQYPLLSVPDILEREATEHEAYAKMRRQTYIARPDYYKALENHCDGNGKPLLLLGESGSGKSALFANWVEQHRASHPDDFIFQHYIGGTRDSSDHWKLISRLIKEIKRWTGDSDILPGSNEAMLKDLPTWLTRARLHAEQVKSRFIIILDALNQLDDHDHGKILGWLPDYPFTGSLRLMCSTLPNEIPEEIEKRNWQVMHVELLSSDERRRMIICYLQRFGKKLDERQLSHLSSNKSTTNPLYLKTLLDELRVTGIHDKLDERLNEYLLAPDIPTLLQKVLSRYQKDYEHDRPELVAETLGLLWAARRGLSENELMQLLKPEDMPQLPLAKWAPLHAALEEGLVERNGILNFSHDYLRSAVETLFLPDSDIKDKYRTILADYFECHTSGLRSCDELPWLLKEAGLTERLRKCLLNIDNFLLIFEHDEDELRQYWVDLGEEKNIGSPYLKEFNSWSEKPGLPETQISRAANQLALFLGFRLSIFNEAENLYKKALEIDERMYGPDHPSMAIRLNNMAQLYQSTNRYREAEVLMERALKIDEKNFGPDHFSVGRDLNNLAQLLKTVNRLKEAEPLLKRALSINEKIYGPDNQQVAAVLSNLSQLLQDTNRISEAEPLVIRALDINEKIYGKDHPAVAVALNTMATLLYRSNRIKEAESTYIRALRINEKCYGPGHPVVATNLNNMALLLDETKRTEEAEALRIRALEIDEKCYGEDHPDVARDLNNLAQSYVQTKRFTEAEKLMKRALKINEKSLGPDHTSVATNLSNLAQLYKEISRFTEAEILYKRALKIFSTSLGEDHPTVAVILNNYAGLLKVANRIEEAEVLMKRSLEIEERCYGTDHPRVAVRLNNIAGLLRSLKRYEEAESLLMRALKINETTYGTVHPTVATCMNNLSQILEATGRLTEAECLIEKALAIDEKCLGSDHPEIAIRLNNLALVFHRTNRLKEALPLLERALKINEEHYGPYDSRVATTMNNLAHLLKAVNRTEEAAVLIEKALKIDEKNYGNDHPNVAKDLNNLVVIYFSVKRLKDAEPLARRVIEISLKDSGPAYQHNLKAAVNNYKAILSAMDLNEDQISNKLKEIGLN